MNEQDKIRKQFEIYDWMCKKGYDRKASKDISEIIRLYFNEVIEPMLEQKETEIWNAAIDAAAEGAEVIDEPDYQGGSYGVVDKQSILNLKK